MTAEKSVLYCIKDLPKFLEPRLKAGLLETTATYKAAIEEALPNITLTPEPTVLTDTTPAPTTKKKTTKKTTTTDANNP